MTETPSGPLPTLKPLERLPRPSQSLWPPIIAVALAVVLVGGIIYYFQQDRGKNEPWRINYPGLTWLRGTDANTAEGLRYLQAEVRFDVDVLSASEFQPFLGELVKQSKGTYVYYHIRAQNKRGQYVLDGVARRDGTFSIKEGPDYQDQ